MHRLSGWILALLLTVPAFADGLPVPNGNASQAYLGNGTIGTVPAAAALNPLAFPVADVVVTTGTASTGVALDPAGVYAYVANAGSNNVSVINLSTNAVVHTITTGNVPAGIAVNPAGYLHG
jgi:YVTN family beta-propeller protein